MKPTDALVSKFILVQNSTRFGYFLYPSSGVSYCTFGNGTCYTGLACYTCYTGLTTASCRQTCITCAIAECTVANSWWWVEEIPETCRDLYKNKFGNECFCWFHLKVFRLFVSFTRMSITTLKHAIYYAFVIIFQSHPTEQNICTSKCLSVRIEVYCVITLDLYKYCVASEGKCDTICISLHYICPA
jgi:hypothetical protein